MLLSPETLSSIQAIRDQTFASAEDYGIYAPSNADGPYGPADAWTLVVPGIPFRLAPIKADSKADMIGTDDVRRWRVKVPKERLDGVKVIGGWILARESELPVGFPILSVEDDPTGEGLDYFLIVSRTGRA